MCGCLPCLIYPSRSISGRPIFGCSIFGIFLFGSSISGLTPSVPRCPPAAPGPVGCPVPAAVPLSARRCPPVRTYVRPYACPLAPAAPPSLGDVLALLFLVPLSPSLAGCTAAAPSPAPSPSPLTLRTPAPPSPRAVPASLFVAGTPAGALGSGSGASPSPPCPSSTLRHCSHISISPICSSPASLCHCTSSASGCLNPISPLHSMFVITPRTVPSSCVSISTLSPISTS